MDIAVDVFKIIDAVLKNTQNDCPNCERLAELIVQKDICYYDECPKDCLVDTYMLPEFADGNKKPAMLYIHGGGFVAGDKNYRTGTSNWFACNGITVFNVNYGLCPDYRFPEPLKHLVKALEYIKNNAKELNIDTDKVIVAGDSAGAYYAAMLACGCNSDKLSKIMQDVPHLKISAAILNCGVYDLTEILKLRFPLGIDKKLFYDFTGFSDKNFKDYELYDMVSPIAFVDSKFPPCFIIHAKKDVLCRGQADCFMQKLDENNVYYESSSSNRFLANHCYSLNWKDKDAIKANTALLDFLTRFSSGDISITHPRRHKHKGTE